jgi:hypothetical protein
MIPAWESKAEVLVGIFFYLTGLAIIASAVLLYGVWREVRMVLHALNGGCLP